MSATRGEPVASLHAGPPHTLLDDIQAGATSVVLVSLGLVILGSAGLMTGGTPGLAFLLCYWTGLPLGAALFAVNVPFYLLAWRRMGARFTAKTLIAETSLSLGVELVRNVLAVQASPAYAALAGGILVGTGLLVMFRHEASFGGVNILALYLSRRAGWSVGRTQLAIDAAIFVAALLVVDWHKALWSALGSLAVNAVLVWNHRPGRYQVSVVQ